MLRIITLLVFVSISSTASAQFWKKKKKAAPPIQRSQPTALNPVAERDYAPKKTSRKQAKGPTYDGERRFYERMEELEKTRRKNEKLAQKPQYSDPMYFGHKRPPKKRKPGKMKYCKECGLRH